MDLRLTPAQERLRAEVEDFLEGALADIPDAPVLEVAPLWSRTFSQRLAERGWIALPWPKEYGGADLTPLEQLIFNERMAYRRAPVGYHRRGVYYIGPALMRYGTPEQKAHYLGGITAANISFCQAFSEPNAGSDLASVQTRAVRSGDDYVIDGAKVWTTDAHEAEYAWLLARTDPAAPKHRGLSIFVVPMDTPGIEVRPLIDMAGQHRFNELRFDSVRVPREALVGDENEGWRQAMTTLEFERSNITHFASLRRILDDVRPQLSRPSPSIRARLVDCWIGNSVGYQLAWNVASAQERGCLDARTASIVKLFGAELWQRVADTCLAALGMSGNVTEGAAGAVNDVAIRYLTARSTSIAGGTTEVQRGVIAARGLGLR